MSLYLDKKRLDGLIEIVLNNYHLSTRRIDALTDLTSFVIGGEIDSFSPDEIRLTYHCLDYAISKHRHAERKAPIYDPEKKDWLYIYYSVHPLEVGASMYSADAIEKIAGVFHDLAEEVSKEVIKRIEGPGSSGESLAISKYDEIYQKTLGKIEEIMYNIYEIEFPGQLQDNRDKVNNTITRIINTVNKLTRRVYQDYYADVSKIFEKRKIGAGGRSKEEFDEEDMIRAANVKMKDRENNIRNLGWEVDESEGWRSGDVGLADLNLKHRLKMRLRSMLEKDPLFIGDNLASTDLELKADTLNYDHRLASFQKIRICKDYAKNRISHLLRYRKGFHGPERLQELYKNVILINEVRKKLIEIEWEEDGDPGRYDDMADLTARMEIYMKDLIEASLEQAVKYRDHVKKYHINPITACSIEEENARFKNEGGYNAITSPREGSRFHGLSQKLFDPVITDKNTKFLKSRNNQYLGAIALSEILMAFKENEYYTLEGMSGKGLEAIDKHLNLQKKKKKAKDKKEGGKDNKPKGGLKSLLAIF